MLNKCEFQNLNINTSICQGKVQFNSIKIGKNMFPLNPTATDINENKCLVLSYQILSLVSAGTLPYAIKEVAAAPVEGGAPAEGGPAPAEAEVGPAPAAPTAAKAEGDGEAPEEEKTATAAKAPAPAPITEEAAPKPADAAEAAADAAEEKAAAEAEAVKTAVTAVQPNLAQLVTALQNLLKAVQVMKTPPQTQNGGSMHNLMQRIVDNKPNLTSMYPVKVTRRYRTNRRNRRTNRRRRKSYTRR